MGSDLIMNINQMKEKSKDLFRFIEIYVSDDYFNEDFRQEEFEKILFEIISGVDSLKTFKRRRLGITDEKWDNAKKNFYESIGINYE